MPTSVQTEPYSQEQYLSADEILEARDIQVHDFPVPEWTKEDANGVKQPGILRLRMLSARDLALYIEAVTGSDEDKRKGMVEIVRRSMVKSDGLTLLFADARSVVVLMEKSTAAMNRVQNKIIEINGIVTNPKVKNG